MNPPYFHVFNSMSKSIFTCAFTGVWNDIRSVHTQKVFKRSIEIAYNCIHIFEYCYEYSLQTLVFSFISTNKVFKNQIEYSN